MRRGDKRRGCGKCPRSTKCKRRMSQGIIYMVCPWSDFNKRNNYDPKKRRTS
jgi:hypothetical protein